MYFIQTDKIVGDILQRSLNVREDMESNVTFMLVVLKKATISTVVSVGRVMKEMDIHVEVLS